MTIETATMPIVRINAPEFYRDPEFLAWLNNPVTNVATWHQQGDTPGEYSDLFFTYDNGDGCNTDMPAHIWEQICEAVDPLRCYNGECLIWLSNLEEPCF